MTGNSILIDTNIVSFLLEEESQLAHRVDMADSVTIPLIVIGELYYGASNSKRVAQNTSAIEKVIALYTVIFPDIDPAKIYGVIKTRLRQKGKPIPENDIWIAALSIQHGLKLISRDQHFLYIDDLDWEVW